MNIFLIGFMGCGKSTYGKRLAKELGYDFVDTDTYIEQKEGKSINEIFSLHGEQYFRELEHTATQDMTLLKNTVVATGGGLPCFFDNMDIMNKAGKTIYLYVEYEVLADRLESIKSTRPLLKDKTKNEILAYINEVLPKREVFYNKAQEIKKTCKI